MTATVYIATSIDGYIADAEGGLDWLSDGIDPEQGDLGFDDFLSGIDAIVMGRITFQTVLASGQWPYSKKVFVLSRTLSALPEDMAGKAEIIAGTPAEIMEKLAALGHSRLYVDGGNTVQSFLEADLIDHLIITRIPIILGGGVPLFGSLSAPLRFELSDTRMLAGRMVQSSYDRVRR
ncbi:MAG: dihydrofolate reductase family protein [Pseudomonadota bacterium]